MFVKSTFFTLCLLLPLLGQQNDARLWERVQAEANSGRSQVARYAEALCANGPRLAGSPASKAAAGWAKAELAKLGLKAWIEDAGPFGASWSGTAKAEANGKALNAEPSPWSAPTRGTVRGGLIFMPFPPIAKESEIPATLAKYEASLNGANGKIVLFDPTAPIANAPAAKIFSDAELAELAKQEQLCPKPADFAVIPKPRDPNYACFWQWWAPRYLREQVMETNNRLRTSAYRILFNRGVLAVVRRSRNSDNVSAAQSTARNSENRFVLPAISLTAAEYNELAEAVQAGQRLELAVRVDSQEYPNARLENVLAEMQGAGRLKQEIVFAGAHLDSVSLGQGIADNASGVATVMEAVRILKALRLPAARTIRVGLWDGEEHGLLGSLAYIAKHSKEASSVVASFTADSGTGRIRGLYLPMQSQSAPLVGKWLAELKTDGSGNIALTDPMTPPGSSDHMSFYEAGVPAFAFIQDPLDYAVRSHSNADRLTGVNITNLRHNAAVAAWVLYQAANSQEMLPRPTAYKR